MTFRFKMRLPSAIVAHNSDCFRTTFFFGRMRRSHTAQMMRRCPCMRSYKSIACRWLSDCVVEKPYSPSKIRGRFPRQHMSIASAEVLSLCLPHRNEVKAGRALSRRKSNDDGSSSPEKTSLYASIHIFVQPSPFSPVKKISYREIDGPVLAKLGKSVRQRRVPSEQDAPSISLD
jgi:hypothetical protein